MRIIAGRFRSRRLRSVPGTAVRPTPDRLREAMFNMLTPRMEGSLFVDAYAGSGAVGLEALSRGAREVVLIERSSAALEVIRRNVAELGVDAEVRIVKGSAAHWLRNFPANVVFLDPPYTRTGEYATALAAAQLLPGGCVIAQHASRFEPALESGRLRRIRTLRQGDNTLSIYETTYETTGLEL